MSELRNHILESLSFYQAMSIEELLMEFDQGVLEQLGDLNIDDLTSELKGLEKEKRIVSKEYKGALVYQRILKKKSLLQRVISYIRR